ncbi:AMP-binding protein [Minwuia sp.]|uniref:AMP-binding protein n=1 Tax=Minwuia sp. TaxID=2493630 RepID=UPI003A8F449D
MTEMSFGRNLAEMAESQPDRIVITHNDQTWTARDFHRFTNRLARDYQRLGVKRNDLVTIALPNGWEFMAACWATWKAGATPQPVSARLPRFERDAIIEVAEAALVVGSSDPSPNGCPVLSVGHDPQSDDESDLEDLWPDRWKAPTSGGSTGRPKLIVDANPALYDFDQAMLNGKDVTWLEQRPFETHLVVGPLYHNGPFSFAMQAFLRRNHIVIADRFDAEDTLRLIEHHRANWMMMVPTMMHRIWRLPEDVRNGYDLSSLRVMLHLAAPCPPWLKEEWINWLGADRIFELMGGTEATGVTWITGEEWMSHKGSVGRLKPGSSMKIVRDDGSEAAVGEVGEVFFLPDGGQGSTYTYLGAESKAIDGGWESLGDMGYVDEEGYLYLTDRRADMILSGGANIYPAEVEAAIELFPGVRSCVVIGLPDDDLGNRVHAIVDAPDGLDEDGLRAFLAERLVRYKIPRSFEASDDGPLRDDAGKVRRKNLRADRLA